MDRLERLDKYSAKLEDRIAELENKIIELSADLGLYQNENTSLTKDIEKYWQIEQELGCTFETIVNATKYGIIDWEGKEHTVVFQENCLHVVENDKLQYSLALTNYRKSWWVKGEKKDENN